MDMDMARKGLEEFKMGKGGQKSKYFLILYAMLCIFANPVATATLMLLLTSIIITIIITITCLLLLSSVKPQISNIASLRCAVLLSCRTSRCDGSIVDESQGGDVEVCACAALVFCWLPGEALLLRMLCYVRDFGLLRNRAMNECCRKYC